jgi:dipeptidyl aminopeptidase/acylaminoacyl peptidase
MPLRSISCLILTLLSAVSLYARMPKQYTIEQFLNTTSIFGSSFSADEKSILVSSNQTGIYNAFQIPVAGGKPAPLTASTKDSTYAVSYFPHDNRILFSRDSGGNERTHLFIQDLDGHQSDLTPGEKTKAFFGGWTFDESAFFFLSNARNERFFDLYRAKISDLTPQLIYQDDTGYNFSGVSDDEKYIAFSKPKTDNDSDIYLYTVESKQLKHLTPHTGEVRFQAQAFSHDSRYLYYLTDDGGEFTYAARYEIATGKMETVERRKWDIEFVYFSRNGKYRVIGVNEDARTKVEIFDAASGKQLALPALPEGQISNVTFSRNEDLMSFYFNGDHTPANLFLFDLKSQSVKQLTDTQNPAIDSADLVDSQVVRYKSFDGMEIPAILYKPQQASAEAQAPALVWVHGGPGGQSGRGYSNLLQFFVNHGYVVLAVNNRGSSGYGKTFYKADEKRHGHEPLWDCVQAKSYLNSLNYVEHNRIGIIGGSYGGYMTLAALTLQPKEFVVGVDLFGISNWVRTLESIPPWWEAQKEALYKKIGDPKADRDMLLTVSPLFNAAKVERPLMILQGANDPRVIKVESDDMVAAIQKKGGIVEYMVFPDEGHGFTKRENQIKGYGAILVFLDRYLKSASLAARRLTEPRPSGSGRG